MTGDDDSLFGRWSRRKRAVAEDDRSPEPQAPAAREEAPAPEDEVAETEAEALARLGLPDPDSLVEGDDFSGFMKTGVPEALRRRALRRLWGTNPVLANVDGLVDYGENYAAAELSPAIVATAYKVGRGFVKAVVDPAEEQAADTVAGSASEDVAAPEGAEGTAIPPGEAPTVVGVEAKGDEASPNPGPAAVVATTRQAPAAEDEAGLRPGRMRFRTDT